jgi:hypothetical protein
LKWLLIKELGEWFKTLSLRQYQYKKIQNAVKSRLYSVFCFVAIPNKANNSYFISDLFGDLFPNSQNRSLEIAETLVQQAVQLLNILL